MRVIPTFKLEGLISDPRKRMNQILEYYLASNPSQTLLYRGHVVSMQSAIFRGANNADKLESEVRGDLAKVFSTNFDEITELDVTVVGIEGNDTRLDIRIKVAVREGEGVYDLARSLDVVRPNAINLNN